MSGDRRVFLTGSAVRPAKLYVPYVAIDVSAWSLRQDIEKNVLTL